MAPRFVFRLTSEFFAGFTWDAQNRETHFQKHGIDFPVVAQVDWTRIKKAPDLRARRGRPREARRHVALAYHPRLDAVLVIVYTKRDRIGRIISVRKANAEETALFHA